MNFFEQELRKLASACSGILNPVFAGRACYGDLGGDNRFKVQFIELDTFEKFEAVKVSVLNRKDGEVDSLSFRFEDVWGRKDTTHYKNLKPHIWTYNGKSEWYAYQPTGADFKQLGKAVGAYLDVFIVRAPTREKAQAQDSVVKKIRESKQLTAPKNKAKRGKSDPEH